MACSYLRVSDDEAVAGGQAGTITEKKPHLIYSKQGLAGAKLAEEDGKGLAPENDNPVIVHLFFILTTRTSLNPAVPPRVLVAVSTRCFEPK